MKQVVDAAPISVTPEPSPTPAVESVAVQIPPAELASKKPTVIEQGALLLSAAVGAARADDLDRLAYRNAISAPMVPASLLSIGSTVAKVSVEGYPPAVSTTVGVFAALGALEWGRAHVVTQAELSVKMPDGYTLQCLRADRDAIKVDPGKVAVVIHPRPYAGSEEPRELASKRLAEALDVVVAATAKPKGAKRISHIIIPASTARQAGLPYEGNGLISEIIDDITTQTPRVPYSKYERALVVPVNKAAELAELARSDRDPLLARVFDEIGLRFPGKREALQITNPRIVKVLHGLLTRAAAEGSGVRLKQKETKRIMVKDQNDDGTDTYTPVDAWTGGWQSSTEDVMTLIDTASQFNPRIQQRISRSGQLVLDSDLRSHTGGDTPMLGIVGKLKDNQYDNLALIRVGLELLEQKQEIEKTARNVDLAKMPRGSDPSEVTLAPASEQTNYGRLRARFAGRVVVGAMLAAGAFTTITGIADFIKSLPIPKVDLPPAAVAPSLDSASLWRVDEHAGMIPGTAYWPEETNYHYSKRSGWYHGETESDIQKILPQYLENSNVPHLTVKGILDHFNQSIPVAENMAVAAIRAFDRNEALLPVFVYRDTDGTTRVHVPAAKDGYRLEYDLVTSTLWDVAANRPMEVEGAEGIEYPSQYPGAAQGVEAQAAHIHQNFVYDLSSDLSKIYSRTHVPNNFVEAVYDQGRCMCLQCNAAVGMVQSVLHPDRNLALVTGWTYEDAPGDHGYLGDGIAHAWLDSNGLRSDATAGNRDRRSGIRERKREDLDRIWDQRQAILSGKIAHDAELPDQDENEPLPIGVILYPMLGMLAAGLVGAELRTRIMRRMVSSALRADAWITAAEDIDPRDAVRLIGWQAFGRHADPVPQPDNGKTYRGESPSVIPVNVLKEVKRRGGFQASGQLTRAQDRGVRHTAAAILRDHKHAPKRAPQRRKRRVSS